MNITEERMSDHFTKFHFSETLPFPALLHRFSSPDRGDAHDHPWGFRTFILRGGYIEEVFNLDGSSEIFHRKVGDSFVVKAETIHKIIELPEGECWTFVLPEAPTGRTSGFFQFREDGVFSRKWHEPEFTPHQP